MILVDSSVWIRHFKKLNVEFAELLANNAVMIHPMIIGELACGSMKYRTEILQLLMTLPRAESCSLDEVVDFIEHKNIHGKRIGWVDANLLASAMVSKVSIWTFDRPLSHIARELGV